MKCPRRLKSCRPMFYHEFENGRYICGGVLTRKGRGGVKMDVCRRCFTSEFHPRPEQMDTTPDEAMVFAMAHLIPAYKWLDDFEAFNDWREKNDA